jgi:hypothetical protein
MTEVDAGSDPQTNIDPLAEIPKTTWERIWPALACGSGLFSDGYINNVRALSSPLISTHSRDLGHWIRVNHIEAAIRNGIYWFECPEKYICHYFCWDCLWSTPIRVYQ